MQNDDHQLGYLLSRREAVTLLGAAGYSLLVGCASTKGQQAASGTPGCVVRPEQTQGPYFVDERLNRSDLRVDPSDGVLSPGLPLDLAFVVSRLTDTGCAPLPDAVVDVWHCDHLGVYSDVEDPAFNTIGKKFLRGYQVTDSDGRTQFTTIYPGWYPRRTVHAHFKVRSAPTARVGFDFTSQLYFDDALTDLVQAQEPYAVKGIRTIRNDQDRIYRQGGSQLLLALTPSSMGYAGTFQVALQVA